MSEGNDASDRVVGYKPPPEFEEDDKESLVDLTLSESTELWLIQWPANQPPDFDGQELSLKLHDDGQLGSFEGSSGKVYDVVSFAAQEPDATVFLSSSSDSKIVGKISKRVSLVHYPDPEELVKVNASNMKPMYQSLSGISLTKSSRQFASPSMSTLSRNPNSTSKHTTSSWSNRQKSTLSDAQEPTTTLDQTPQGSSKKRRVHEPTRSTDKSSQNSGRAHSAVTISGSSEQSVVGKSKKRVKSMN